MAYYSSRLVYRHPNAFKSLNSSVRRFKPHQYQQEMCEKSTEFTGNLFTKSESKIEDLLHMMSEIQLNVHTYDDEGTARCHERKIVSGDNKTEKNMHHGILRYIPLYLKTTTILGNLSDEQSTIHNFTLQVFLDQFVLMPSFFNFQCILMRR